MSNYKVMFSLRVIKNVLTAFLDSFLVLYFLEVSDNNILPIGIYKLIAIFAIYIVMYGAKNFCKTKNRIYLIRIGILLNFIYFLTILILREKIVNYTYLIRITLWTRRGILLLYI